MHSPIPPPGEKRRRARIEASRDQFVDDAELPTHDEAGKPFPPIRVDDLPADIVLPRLAFFDGRAGDWHACCPAHNDHRPSLSVRETSDGTLLIHCHAGCETDEVMAAIGLTTKYLFPSPYAQYRRSNRSVTSASKPARRAFEEPSAEELAAIDTDTFEAFLAERPASREDILILGKHLGIPGKYFRSLGLGFDPDVHAWLIPERNDAGRIVGIGVRHLDGSKRFVSGGTRGLVYDPAQRLGDRRTVFVAEGASDAAALLSVDAIAIGRPSAKASRLVRFWLAKLLTSRFVSCSICVVGDRDPASNVGEKGAVELAAWLEASLGRPVSAALPFGEFKDVREQIVAGQWGRLHLLPKGKGGGHDC